MIRVYTTEQKERKAYLSRQRRALAKARGLCSSCRLNKIKLGYKQCEECIESGYRKYLRLKGNDHEKLKSRCREWLKEHPDYNKNYYLKYKTERNLCNRLYKKGLRIRIKRNDIC